MHTILATEELRACAATADNALVLGTSLARPAAASEVVRQATGAATAAKEGETHALSLSVTALRLQTMPYMPAHRHLLVWW